MPTTILEAKTTADRVKVQKFQVSEDRTLVAVSVVFTTGSPQKGMLFVEAGVMRGGRDDASKVVVFFQGYVYIGQPGLWSGSFRLDPGDTLYFEARGTEVYTVRASFSTLQKGS
ncbi:hypothetical protein LCGC14_2138140 [marine sediment metagenome]|uniref:Uncharacterized protein n=1 Tax=marine sediment metagenome TaxID=412755 RepID=A0A0F9DZG7_9ZZZZ